jgi:hypothetical protein
MTPTPAREGLPERVAKILKDAGWRDTADAQWDGLRRVIPDIAAALSQPAQGGDVVRWEYRYRHTLPNGGKCDWHRCTKEQAERYDADPFSAYETRALAAALPRPQPEKGNRLVPFTDTEFRLAQVRGKLAWLEECVRDAGCEIDYSEEDCVYNRRAEEAEAAATPPPPSDAALPHPQPEAKPHVRVETIGRVATDRTVLTAALTKLATMEASPPPPSDAAQGEHVRHIGGGLLAIYRGDEQVREIGVTPGWSFRDRDEFIARYNAARPVRVDEAMVERAAEAIGRLRATNAAGNPDSWVRKYREDNTALARAALAAAHKGEGNG